jgi:arylsulfatase A-like enzyme
VALQDLPATVSELVGLREASPFPGHSLLASREDSVGRGAPVLSEVAVADEGEKTPGRWNYRSLIWGNYHYIENPDASEEIYDLENDPWETRDLNTTGSDLPLVDFRDALSSLVGSVP